MRTVYLLRHARPAGAEVSRCLGSRSDPPLSPEGAAAAKMLTAPAVQAVGTGPLLRCTETAALLFPKKPLRLLPGLTELDCGDWDGLSFDAIRTRWPEHYARRGADLALPPPGGESLAHAAARAEAALRDLLAGTEGDVAVVTHDGVRRALLCALTGTSFSQNRVFSRPYLSVYTLDFDGVRFSVSESLQIKSQ